MSPTNLGIVFGPSLIRPRPLEGTVSVCSPVEYHHQARIVEALIVFYTSIFQSSSRQEALDETLQQRLEELKSICIREAVRR